MTDETISLPAGWISGPLAQMIQPRGEKASPADYPQYIFIGMDHVESNTTRIIGSVPASEMKSSAARFYAGDVLYGRLRPYLNKVAQPNFDGLASAEFIVFPDSELVRSNYLKYRLNAHDFVSFATHLNEGDRPRVGFDQIGDFNLLVPPAAEQDRIVLKIDELFSELDKGVESLKVARDQLKAYRQSVLKAAFEGKLTKDWRIENSCKLDAGTALLEYIKMERERQYKDDLNNWKKAVCEAESANLPRPRKPSKPTAADKPSPKQASLMVDLPPSWEWVQLGDFAFVTKLAGFEYTKFVRYDDNGDLEVIKAENAGPNGFRETDFSRIRSETVAALERSQLHGGELLMVFVGAGTGNVAIVPEGRTFFLGPNIGMMRVTSDRVNPQYVEYFLRSPQGRELALSSVKAVAQPSLSMGTIRQIPVALPTVHEQNQIVRILESRLENTDLMEAEIDAGLARAEAMRQSILKRAFFGQLVAQDPSDEPACKVIERFTENRQSGGCIKRGRKLKEVADA